MDEIIKSKDGNYERYEDLLCKRDQLEKEASIYMDDYIRTFGELLTEVFKEKVACIEKKKAISYCQAMINRGNVINQDEFNAYINEQMADYYKQIEQMVADNEAAKKVTYSPEATVRKVKQLYRKIVKLIHPDINPKTKEDGVLSELWNRITMAYHMNNLEDMEELEVLIINALEQIGFDTIDIEIPNIEEKIAAVEARIDEIVSTDPYQYKYLLEDRELVNEKKQNIHDELKEYREYHEELEKILEQLLLQGKMKIVL